MNQDPKKEKKTIIKNHHQDYFTQVHKVDKDKNLVLIVKSTVSKRKDDKTKTYCTDCKS